MSKARTLASAGADNGRKNILINGDMQVWQRSDTYSGSGGIASYQTVDRWWSGTDATNTTQTRNVGIVDGKRVNYISSVVTGQSYHVLQQRIEGLRYLQDQTLTFSFWSKGTAGTFNLYAQFRDGSGNIQNSLNTTYTQSSNWTKHTWTFTVPSNALFDGNNTWFDISVYGGSTLELTLCQLERGSIATPFEHRSYGEELALCQRYYYANISGATRGTGNSSGAAIIFSQPFPVTMRTAPSLSIQSGPMRVGDMVATGYVTSNANVYANYNSKDIGAYYVTGFSGLTPHRSYMQEPQSGAAGYIAFDAEL